MADYNYKGYIAKIYEERLREDWLTFLSEPLQFKVYLTSEFESYESKPCSMDEAKTIRHTYIKFFEQRVDKHLRNFK